MAKMRYVLLSIFILMINNVIAGQFSANVEIVVNGNLSQSGKIYVDGNRRRVEMKTIDGVSTALIIDTTKKSGYVLLPAEKKYAEMSDMSSFVEGGKIINSNAAKQIGSELVGGYTCQILQVNNDGVIQKYWYAKQLDFPIKIVTEVNGVEYTKTEYKNIKAQKQDSALFNIPRGFKKAE